MDENSAYRHFTLQITKISLAAWKKAAELCGFFFSEEIAKKIKAWDGAGYPSGHEFGTKNTGIEKIRKKRASFGKIFFALNLGLIQVEDSVMAYMYQTWRGHLQKTINNHVR